MLCVCAAASTGGLEGSDPLQAVSVGENSLLNTQKRGKIERITSENALDDDSKWY